MRYSTRKLKRPLKATLAALCTTLFISLAGCSLNALTGGATEGKGYNPDFAVAVIQTNRQTPFTFIDYFDEDLNLVASLEYPYKTTQRQC